MLFYVFLLVNLQKNNVITAKMKKIFLIIGAFLLIFAIIAANRSSVDDEDLYDGNTSEEYEENKYGVTDEMEQSSNVTLSENKENNISRYNNSALELPAPLTDRPEQIIVHTGFVVSYNKNHNTPNWSAWNLTAEHAYGDIPRGNKFWADENVPMAYRVEYYEYKGSGYDRGHMCPAGDNKWSRDAMHDSFYMTNMCPQDPQLNGESWRLLEEACRRWVMTERSLYIVCGPVYRGISHEQIGTEHKIDVPEAFFKAVLSLRSGHEKAIAFLYENTSRNQSMGSTAMSVDEIEKIIGMDLFHNLDDDLESKLESQYSVSEWR